MSPLLCRPEDKARLENENALDQLDLISYLVQDLKIREIRESHVLELQKLAIQNIYPCGGTYRDALVRVQIANSPHEIPESALVPGLVREALAWINEQAQRSTLERAAFALWRFNWIHPFRGGNGRTSRALAYLILCMAERTMLPGSPVMPDLIYDRRDEYIRALQAVDAAAKLSPENPDFGPMVEFLRQIITTQLAAALNNLSGGRRNRAS
jgi:Fic family protein